MADGSVLYSVDTATGVATEVGDLGVELSGMTYDPTSGTFYGVFFAPAPDPTPLYEIDVATATATEIGTGTYSTAIALAATPGVVESGLFLGMADMVVIGRADQVKIFKRPKAQN